MVYEMDAGWMPTCKSVVQCLDIADAAANSRLYQSCLLVSRQEEQAMDRFAKVAEGSGAAWRTRICSDWFWCAVHVKYLGIFFLVSCD